MNIQYRVFYKGKQHAEFHGTQSQCEHFKKERIKFHNWDASKFEIKGGFENKGFKL